MAGTTARNRNTRITKRERMRKLFDTGKMLYFTITGDGQVVVHDEAQEDGFAIWVRPADPLQRQEAVTSAQAARAMVVISARSEYSNEWMTIKGYIASLDDEALAAYVVGLGEDERLAEARRHVLKQEEWKDFNQLRDAMRDFEESGDNQDDPKWAPLFERDNQFADEVEARARELREAAVEAMKLIPRPKLEEKAFEGRLDEAGTNAFISRYAEELLYYGCRDDEDHSVLFFEDVEDMKRQPESLQNALRAKLAEFVNDAGEAKNSQGVASSSTSSVPPVEPETSESSTPTESIE